MFQRGSLVSISRIAMAGLMLVCLGVVGQAVAQSAPAGMRVATGQRITPAAAAGTQVLRLHTDLRSGCGECRHHCAESGRIHPADPDQRLQQQLLQR